MPTAITSCCNSEEESGTFNSLDITQQNNSLDITQQDNTQPEQQISHLHLHLHQLSQTQH